MGLTLQAGGYGFAALSVPEGDVPGVVGGLLFANRAGIITAAGGAVSLAAAGVDLLNGVSGPAAATVINKIIASKIAPEGFARDAVEAALNKADGGAISKALGCK